MKILLAGYNVDTEVLKALQENSPSRQDVTPETISAAYARISRDPRPVNELREAARQEVERTRKSNKTIIFKMGHHSVAEHAVFNFDIIGVSRLAIEELEHFRLCSFTEKSQRYITLGNDFVIPEEIKGTPWKDPFCEMIKTQNKLYHKLYNKLHQYTFDKNKDLAQDPKKHNLLDGWAKEDARYITALATEGQLGETINARNLELLLRRFASHQLTEIRELGSKLSKLVEKVAPSIILFYQANDYDQKTYPELYIKAEELKAVSSGKHNSKDEVSLVDHSASGDDITLSALLHTTGNLSFSECSTIVKKMNHTQKHDLIKTALQYMELYDTTPREFEYPQLTFELVISASCFAQLKRHRTATLTVQPYNPELGITIPEAIKEIGMENDFRSVIEQTEDLYYKIGRENPAASYVLTNAHRRRVLFSCNARELYHVSRLREDSHAQWDIRQISAKMSNLAKTVMPLTMLLIGGKDKYPEIYRKVFKKDPKVISIP